MNERGQIVALVVQEHYEDGNSEHYHHHVNKANKEEEEEDRDLDRIEIIRNPISESETETNLRSNTKTSENTNYQAATKEITVHLPSQIITKNGNPQAEESDDDRDSHKNPTSEEVEMSKVGLNVALEQKGGRPDLNERNFELGADRFEDDSGRDQEFDYEIPRVNIGHLESDIREDVSSGGSTRVSLNSELGVSSDTNLETREVVALHFANSLLASVMENLEEGEEEEPSTYNDNLNFFRIPTIEDAVAMTEQNPAAAGTPGIFQVAGHTMHGGFHGGVYDRGEYPANKKRKITAEVADCSGGYGFAASDSLLPNNGAEGYSSGSQNMYSQPAGGYGSTPTNNAPQNYLAERDVFDGLNKVYSLLGEYGLAVNDGRPPEYGATGTADTNFDSDIIGQRYFSHDQYGAPIIMESYPVTSNQDSNDEILQSSFDNTQIRRLVAPVVQPQTQMPRSGHNPECYTILPSIELDLVDENNTGEQQSELSSNQANLRPLDKTYFARGEDTVHWGTSLNMHAPDWRIQYVSPLAKGYEAEFNNSWTNQQIEEDPNPATKFFDSIPIAEDTCVNQLAKGWNDTLETEGKAAMDDQMIGNSILQQMPDSFPKKLHTKPFFFGKLRNSPKSNRPRRPSLTSVRSPDPFSPPRETGPEIPKYDFSNGEVPALPPDFNTAQEIKRRLVAKYAISPLYHDKRCKGCGYMGHAISWHGCPSLVCKECEEEGHGWRFCTKTKIAQRWRCRSGRQTDAQWNATQIKKAKKKQGLKEPTGNQNAERYSQERLSSPRSLLMKRQKLADENQARSNEEVRRAAPVSNMITWPTARPLGNSQTIFPMNQAPVSNIATWPIVGGTMENSQTMFPMNQAPVSNMATWPTVGGTQENSQTIFPMNQAPVSNMTTWPTVGGASENTQSLALPNQAQGNEGERGVPIAQMAAWPIVQSSESEHNIASTSKDSWSHVGLNALYRPPWENMNNTGMLRTTDAQQMMATGPRVNLNSVENPPNMVYYSSSSFSSSTANNNWAYTEWQQQWQQQQWQQQQQPFGNSGINS